MKQWGREVHKKMPNAKVMKWSFHSLIWFSRAQEVLEDKSMREVYEVQRNICKQSTLHRVDDKVFAYKRKRKADHKFQ